MGKSRIIRMAPVGVGGHTSCRCAPKNNQNGFLPICGLRGYASRTETKLKTISEKINSKYKVETTYFSCDLADKDGPQNIFNFCESKKYHVDILVNNAGYALPNSFEKNTVEEEEKCIRVLGTSVISLTKPFLTNKLKKR